MSVWYRKPTFSTAWSPSSWRSERHATPRPRYSGSDGEAGCAAGTNAANAGTNAANAGTNAANAGNDDLTAHADLPNVGAGLPGGNQHPFDIPVRRPERVFGVCLALSTEGGADLRIKHCLDTPGEFAGRVEPQPSPAQFCVLSCP